MKIQRFVDEEENADAETNDEPAMENSGQVSETTDDGITLTQSVSHNENLPQACHIPVDSVLRPVWHQL